MKSLAVTLEMFGGRPWPRFRHFLPMLRAAIIGVALAAAAALLVSGWEDRNVEQEFNAVAENHYLVLQDGLNKYLNKILTLRALFESSNDRITREEFEAFARLHLEADPAIQTLSWVPRVRRDARAFYESAAAHDGLEGYHFKVRAADGKLIPSLEQEEYYPIFYSTVPRASQLYGLDLRAEPRILTKLESARDDDQLGFSTVPALLSADGRQHGHIFSLPVYQQGLPHDTVEDRRRNLVGFVHGSFITAKMIDAVLTATAVPQGLDLLFFEPDGRSDEPPLYVQGSHLRTVAMESGQLALRGAKPRWSREILAGNSTWLTLVALPTPGGPFAPRHDRAWITLLAGLLADGVIVFYLWTSARYARRMEVLALTDPLTTLANRRAFLERLSMAFATRRSGASPFAVLFIDLDDFKDINDTLGHAIGDALLRQVAKRLKKAVRPSDLVARFGGDEFAILQEDASDPTAAVTLAARVGTCLAAPFAIEGHEVRVTASTGISPYSDDLAGAESMMTQADLALYRAKDDGGNCFRFHTGELDQQVTLRATLGEELRLAINGGELELYYQPLVDIVSGRIVGLEALVRWNHPTRGLILPSIFIPIAERTGAIVPLGLWVFDEACRQFKRWRDQGIAPHVLAVNVSGVQFKNASDLELGIAASLARWGIKPGNIEVELTETVLMEMKQKSVDALERLRQLGLRVAIDDFGTGYSSLKYLTIYPVSRLKIAQELVFRITTDSRNATVVRVAIRLAQELGIKVIAEGVETEAQAKFLLSAGCAFAQGYYFTRPVPGKRATELLRQGKIDFTRIPIPRLDVTAA